MATATKVDYAQRLTHLYRAHPDPELVDVPPMRFLMVDGEGLPDGAAGFRDVVRALYTVAYDVAFRVREHGGVDLAVMPLEGLWWIPHAHVWDFGGLRAGWAWTLMVMQPDEVSDDLARTAIDDAVAHDAVAQPALRRIRLETLAEGRAVQALHVGPFDAERATLERLRELVVALGLVPTGKHHEIYLSDPDRTSPDRLRTILRQPVGDRA